MIIAARISLNLGQLGYDVVGIVPRGEEAIQHCRQSPPDIILMDIQLKGGIDGVETARKIQKEMDIPFIYLTANADQTNFDRAKQTRPYAFISKPYKKLDLQRAIELVVNRIDKQDMPGKVLSGQKKLYVLSDRIFLRHQKKIVRLLLKDILYIEADRCYCRIFTKDAEHILSMPLKKLEEKLSPRHFIRLHRSYAINMLQIEELFENHVVIAKQVIPIGKSYKKDFLRRIPST